MKKCAAVSILIMLAFSLNSCQMNTTEPESNLTDQQSLSKAAAGNIAINIILNTAVTKKIISDLGNYGNVMDVISEINAVRILAKAISLPLIKALPYVESANFDAERDGAPIDPIGVDNFADGLSTWNLDAVNVTDLGFDNRTIDYDGTGVTILILDTGLLDSWRQYFPQERILSQYAKSFSGGGAAGLNVSEQPNKWEHDQNSHGTHITSTILGYNFFGTPMNGVSPKASVIPVKVLNQTGQCWSSVIAKGILYAAYLKENDFKDKPLVVNMSLGGSALDAVEKEAIDYAISKGVIIVASAGNRGSAGMGYPGAYAPVISVAAAGPTFVNEGGDSWWFAYNIPDPLTNYNTYYIIPDFSSRAKEGQDLDVTAPGQYIVGPYQLQSGKISYYFLDGTSMATPHVTGIAALILQKYPYLTAAEIENRLESAAIPIPGYTSTDQGSGFITADTVLN